MNRRGGLRKSKSLDGRENYTSISIHDEEEEDSNNSLATFFTKQMKELPDIPSECCIYRVPPTLRVLNEKLYMPQMVSVGPFHHNKNELKGMEEHKLRCMKVFLRRTRKSLDDFITVIRGFEKRARNCYAEKISLSVDEFVRMLIVDSFFIFEAMMDMLSGYSGQDFYVPMHPFFLTTDLILLENQIPFFVLNELFELAFPEEDRGMTFLELSIYYIIDEVLVKNKSNLFGKVDNYLKLGHEVKHLVDLLRICHLPTALRSPSAKNRADFISIPNAMQLQEAGIQLLKLDTSNSLLDINYNEGVLKIPEWVLQAWSEIVLSNILVLENCHYFLDSYVRDYVVFMQMLVDTDKDADLLIQNGIIEDLIGRSSTVATLFNKVGPEFLFYSSSYYFYDISENLNAYCNVTRHKWKATFKRDYCSTPWMIASTTAAVMLLILTFLSTIAAFLAL